jgi:hypothetical protein
MSHHNNEYDLPPQTAKEDGTVRMVGFELEFSGISLDQTAEVVQSTLGDSWRPKPLRNGLFTPTRWESSSSSSIGTT